MRWVAFRGCWGQAQPLMVTEAAIALPTITKLKSFPELGRQDSDQLRENLTRPGWAVAVLAEGVMGGPLCLKISCNFSHPQVCIDGSRM